MIPRYSDLAANERTYLAWLRTSLALMAFGFLIERFDLLLRTVFTTMDAAKAAPHSPVGRYAGLALVALGLILMLLSTWRFITTTRLLRSDREEPYGIRGVLLTGSFFILLGGFVLFYLIRLHF
jgi:putative membrane protein